jgi:hypothetical protein
MSITRVVIPSVESRYTTGYIANVFRKLNIAEVRNITLTTNSYQSNIAYVDIEEWADTEVAYNIIRRLKENKKEVRVVHKGDDWWVLRTN